MKLINMTNEEAQNETAENLGRGFRHASACTKGIWAGVEGNSEFKTPFEAVNALSAIFKPVVGYLVDGEEDKAEEVATKLH